MKLLYSTTSPYVRKVRMLICICNLKDQVQFELVDPFENESLRATNPLGKIPVLVDDELTLFDSALICEYLDEKSHKQGAKSLFHRGRGDYFQIQLLHARANGIIDAAVSSLLENRRTDAERSQHWLNRWCKAIRGSIETLEVNTLTDAEHPNIGTIVLASALGYLDFRFDQFGWRNWNEGLATWFSRVEKQYWFVETLPE